MAVLMLAFSCGTMLQAAAAKPHPPTAAEPYFKAPEFTAPALSPDGRSIGFIAQSNGCACLFRLDRSTGQIQGVFSAGEGDVEAFWWVGNQRVLVAARGAEGMEYFAQDLGGTKSRPISSLKGWPAKWVHTLPHDTDHVIAYYFWGEQYLARIDLNSGRSAKIESFNSLLNYTVVSATGELRAKIWAFAGQWHVAWRTDAEHPWHTVESTSENLPLFIPAGMAADDRHILVYAHDQGDTEALMVLDPETDQRTFLAQRPKRDTYELIGLGAQQGAVGVSFYNNGPEELAFFDETAKGIFAALDLALPGMIHRVTSSSADGSLRIVQAWPADYPSRFYLFDAAQHRLSLLGEERPDLPPGSLGQVHYFSFKTRDGVDESGYVLLPQKRDAARPAPLIVTAMKQVGERARAASDYGPHDQFFAERGYAVAHVAVRGTAGFGRAFEKAGDFQIGKIVQDYEDGIAQLARDGLIDPHRVAFMGTGRGALFALYTATISKSFQAVVAREPDTIATATSVGWLSSSRAEITTVIKQAGGTQAAYQLVHEFDPEALATKLSTPVLLVDSSGDFRSTFKRHHVNFELPKEEIQNGERVKLSVYQARYLSKIADYLDKTLN